MQLSHRFFSRSQADKKNLRYILLIFISAFLFRILIVSVYKPNLFPPDGTGYYRIAVNLIKGNGYSNQEMAPYIPEFAREPAYPYFLATGLKLFDLFGGSVEYLDLCSYNENISNLEQLPSSIQFLRIWQSLFDSISLIFLFLILSFLLNKRKSFIIVFLYSIFFPVAFHNIILYREVFQSFILIIFNYFIVVYLFKKKWYLLIPIGILLAISNLTLYFTIVFCPVIFFFFWINLRSFKKAFTDSVIIGTVMVLFMTPWLILMYNHYPDIRIYKTPGTALTHEWRAYWNTHFDAFDWEIINEEDFRAFLNDKAYNRPYYEYYDKSFNNYYNTVTDSMKTRIEDVKNQATLLSRINYSLENILRNSVVNFWVKKEWGQEHNIRYFIKVGSYWNILLYSIPFVFGVFCIVGFILHVRNFIPVLIVFITFMMMSYLIGDLPRRLLPSFPYVFTFGILFIYDIKERYFPKLLRGNYKN